MKRFYLSYGRNNREKDKAWRFAQNVEKASRKQHHPYESEYWASCSTWLYLHEDYCSSETNIQDMKRADAFVMLSEYNYSYTSYVEYGIALALEKPTYIIRDSSQKIEVPYFEKASLIVSEQLFLQHPFLNFEEYVSLARTNPPRSWKASSSKPVYVSQAAESVIYEVMDPNHEKHWRVKKIEDPQDVFSSFFSLEDAMDHLKAISKVDEPFYHRDRDLA